ncbi:MerR family transcriptional regulator [Streptomyces sp. SPB074]|uniref:MerR family transcriptional regulator n=1 Tax=Streptomyces sp. (strain SPB074) TaxID=465543 RepID=UPI00017FEC7F|nr:MerR family transcriptional regulator [Streptomyces sp. SPB074]EDY45340.1 regulatory protein, MerR [Streptomyces sp. SPB074]
MRISELSRRSGVSVPTIKYYIREELLPPGRLVSATQAEYDEQHLRRLRLLRALIGTRGLSVDTTRQVLLALAERGSSPHHVLGLALGAIRVGGERAARDAAETSAPAGEPDEAERSVTALLEELGWDVYKDTPAREALAETLAALRRFGVAGDWRTLLPYARLAADTARLDLDQLDGLDDPLEMAERAVVVTTLLEPALLALRRLAQEHESARRHES